MSNDSQSIASIILDFRNSNEDLLETINEELNTDLLENQIINNVLEESFHEKNPIKHVINENGKKLIKFENFQANKHEIKCCPIFLTDFNENDEIAILPCNHIFCKNAILRWLEEEDNHCPTCRYPLEYKEKKEIYQTSPQLNYSNTPNAPSLFDFILHRLEDQIEQRQIESIILQNYNDNNLNYEYNNSNINNE